MGPQLLISLALIIPSSESNPLVIRDYNYREVINRVVAMPSDNDLHLRVNRMGMNVLNVLWEDTGRAAGSALGPNISDVTLQVREQVPGGIQTHLLPVIRFPNFTDKTGDIRAGKLWVRVGNHKKGESLHAVPLSKVLSNLRTYLSDPASLRGSDDFTARRDTHYLVSAQHVFVPVPKGGKAEFNPVIFNYQSAPGSPAVLALLVTREGLSATIVENKPGDQTLQGWGQQLFFNNAGQRTVFTAERRSDVKARIESGAAKPTDQGALEEGADMMMVIQVPLKHENRGYLMGNAASGAMPMESAAPMKYEEDKKSRMRSDVEKAVIGHGEDMGPFWEMGNMKLERDPQFPVRVTVQFYRATSNGIVSEQDLQDVKQLIRKVYDDADYVGSLVVPYGPRYRPTDWIKDDQNGGSWLPWGEDQRQDY
ncbi:MAG: hypothetical protein JW841_06490 [Deltaproteobacteria bacterium]|nr:hypothetical protein [Deltaproteobacteria bacterium]